MTELLDWINRQIESVEIHPLVVIGLFVYEFLSIHPFEDGNGRLLRLLTNLLLLKLDYKFIQYTSLENHIEKKKKEYYEALMDGQKNRYTEFEKADKWILFFLNSILGIIEKLKMKYEQIKSGGTYLNERQKLIKDFILLRQPVRLGDISKGFTHISVNTLKKDLQYMKQEKVIESIGRNRGSVYFIYTEKHYCPVISQINSISY